MRKGSRQPPAKSGHTRDLVLENSIINGIISRSHKQLESIAAASHRNDDNEERLPPNLNDDEISINHHISAGHSSIRQRELLSGSDDGLPILEDQRDVAQSGHIAPPVANVFTPVIEDVRRDDATANMNSGGYRMSLHGNSTAAVDEHRSSSDSEEDDSHVTSWNMNSGGDPMSLHGNSTAAVDEHRSSSDSEEDDSHVTSQHANSIAHRTIANTENMQALRAHATAVMGANPPMGSSAQSARICELNISTLRAAFGKSCKSYVGPSAWLIRGAAAQNAFADYVESCVQRGPIAMASFNTHKLATLSKMAPSAARLGLYCADKRRELRGIRNASEYWPRFQQYFCSLTLEKRADVIVKAHIWMAKNIPMTTPLFMKTLASKGVSGRASIREPNTVGTMVASTCQFLRIINVDLGGAENLALAKTAVWTFVSEWLSEYSQQAGGDLSPMQKTSMGIADLAYLFNSPNARTNNLKVAQSWHLSLMLLTGLRPGSMQADSYKNYATKAVNDRKRRSNEMAQCDDNDDFMDLEQERALLALRKWEFEAFVFEGEKAFVAPDEEQMDLSSGVGEGEQSVSDSPTTATRVVTTIQEPRNNVDCTEQISSDDLLFSGLRVGDVRIYRQRARPGDSEQIVRHRAIVTLRRTKTIGYKAFAGYEYGISWPSSGGGSSNSDESADVECFQPNAATGFLLQSILRGHVDAQCILEDEQSFWSRHPDAVNEVLISTRLENQSPLMRSCLFALPITSEFAVGNRSKRSIAYQLEAEAFHGMRSTIELDINKYTSLIHAFCDSFNIPTYVVSARSFRAGYAQSVLGDCARRMKPGTVLTESMIKEALISTSQWNSSRQALVYARVIRDDIRHSAETVASVCASDWVRSLERASLRSRLRNNSYKPLDTEQARAKCELERQLLLIDSGDGENVGKVPTGAALRRIRDALNTEIFQSTDPIVNGDVDVKYLCFDIKRTVQNVDQMRIGEGDATFDYRIHFL